jgi:hypothetical protein
MYPEVEQFLAARAVADKTQNEALSAPDFPQHGYGAIAGCIGCAAEGPIDEAHEAAVDAAWDALKASSDPLVSWIAANGRTHAYEAVIVLKALPASMAELNDLAQRSGWCGAWVRYRSAAEEAGVLPESEVSA